jgi:hypothetical protein
MVQQTPEFASHIVAMVKGNPHLLDHPAFTEHFLRAVATLSIKGKPDDESGSDTKDSKTS